MRRPNLATIRRRAEAATPGPWKTGDQFKSGTLGSAVAVLSGHLPPVELDPHRNGRADAAFIAHARQDIPAMLAEIVRLQGVLSGRIEGQRGSGLCDCSSADSEPNSPASGERMDHHCDCRAVTTAAMILGAYSATAHADQCGHGTEMDEFYKRRQPETALT